MSYRLPSTDSFIAPVGGNIHVHASELYPRSADNLIFALKNLSRENLIEAMLILMLVRIASHHS